MEKRNNLIQGNARNNYLYGTGDVDVIDGGLGNDYLRGKGGSDELWGGAGSDRFVFERTQAENGLDYIKDYVYAPTAGGGERDVLDFTLVGFARNALSRNSGIENGIDNVVVIVEEEGVTRVGVSPSGDGQPFQVLAVLEGLYAGNLVHFRIGEYTFTRPVQGVVDQGLRHDIGTALRYDIGNGDRNGDGVVSYGQDEYENDFADNDDLFDDRLIVPVGDFGVGMGAQVLIGDRVRGFGGTTAFTPGVTAFDFPDLLTSDAWVNPGWWTDAVHDGEYQVYYGTYDAATDTFTVTSTPGTTADPTSATHTMMLYDNDGDAANGSVGALGGMVFQGVYAASQWYIDQSGSLQYDTDGLFPSQEMSVLDTENVLYGTGADESFDGEDGIDIIYAGAGNDLLFGGFSYVWFQEEAPNPPPDGNDWLYGGTGADVFIVSNVRDAGIDTIKDFNGTEGDAIALAFSVGQAMDVLDGVSSITQPVEGNGPQWMSWSQLLALPAAQGIIGFDDSLTLEGPTLEGALQAASATGGVLIKETDLNLFLLQHGGKNYLYLDTLGNGYGTENVPQDGIPPSVPPDVIVEITGAVGLSASNIYLYVENVTPN